MSHFVVKKDGKYVAWPELHCAHPEDATTWTEKQHYAWRWSGTESGNGARRAAYVLGAKAVRLVPKQRATDVETADE